MTAGLFLPGVPTELCLGALAKAGGSEIASGKFASPESSAALAVNAFGWFIDRPRLIPPLPGLDDVDWPAQRIDVERQLRFPWRGGRHPWLDAVIETAGTLVGVESKRFEPFRDRKAVSLSSAYDRPVWGDRMHPFERMRDELRRGERLYAHLDAAQLVKHAFGLVTQGEVLGKRPILFYIFAEPVARGTHPIASTDLKAHRLEIADFANQVAGSAVAFAACSYREWLETFTGQTEGHAKAVTKAFSP